MKFNLELLLAGILSLPVIFISCKKESRAVFEVDLEIELIRMENKEDHAAALSSEQPFAFIA